MVAEIINAVTGLIKALTAAFKSEQQTPIERYGPIDDHEDSNDGKGDLTRLEDQILKRRTDKRKRQNEKISKS